MSLRRPRWIGALAEAGRSFVEVLGAEVALLYQELSRSRRLFLQALMLLAMAVVLLGWVVGLLATALIAYLQSTDVFSLWQATLLVAALLVAIAVALALWARALVRRIRSPSAVVQSRLEEHFDWARRQVGTAGEDASEEEPGGGH